MNDSATAKITCPFYLSHNRGGGNNITITCECIKTNMGFDVKNRLSFMNAEERNDYMEIFCMDRNDQCPYYEVIYKNKYRER